MTITYSVEADSDDLREARSLFEFVGGNSEDAVRVAINRTGPKVRTKASKAIRSQVRLKARFVKEKLKFKRASRKNLSGAITTPSRGLLLTRYSTDPKIGGSKGQWAKPPPIPSRGIKVKVKPTGRPKTMSNNWFYMVLKDSKALGIVRRRSSGEIAAARSKGKGGGSRGGKIDVAYGPSISQVFNTVRDDVLPEASEIYQGELLDAMRFLLTKKFPKE